VTIRLTPFITIVLLALAGAVRAAAPLGPTITYTLAKDAKVSIAVYDQRGEIVRQLLMGAARTKGKHVEEWNGLDDKGKPAPAGKYSWKMLTSQGLKAEWMTSLGSNLSPGSQIMPGNHVGVIALTRDEGDNLYLMGGCSECVPGMAKVTPAGKALWYSGDLIETDNDGGVGLADGLMFSLLRCGKVIAVDPATGKGQWKADTDWSKENGGGYFPIGVLSLTARGSQLLISNKTKNIVRWLNPKDGSPLEEATISAPVALALDGAGNVLAISGTSVVKFSRADKTPKTLITGLTEPWRLAADPATGEILVAEQGESNQIKRFAADGTLLATYGRKGGRLYGKYDPQDFRGVTGICAWKDGGFVVAEAYAAPRRTAFFDKNGKFLHEWYGGLYYANGGCGDPLDPSIVWFHSGSGEVAKAKIDFVTKHYAVLETYKMIGIGDGIINTGNSMDLFVVRHFGGHTYLINQNNEPRMVMVDEANHRLLPVVASKYYMQHDLNNAAYTPTAFRKAYDNIDPANRDAVMWSDLNGDGLPQPEEMVFSKRMLMTWCCGRVWPDENMNLYEMNEQPMMWRPKEWTKGGAPVYGGWPDWKPLGAKPTWFNPLNVAWPAGSGIIPTADGGLYGFFNSTENPFGKGIGSDGLGGNFIVKWDKTGKIVWHTGFHSPDFGAAPGQARFFWNFAGLAHGCAVITDEQCYYAIKNLVYVWDPDGLWVGQLLEHPDLKAAPEEAYNLATENFGGTLLEVTAKNKVPGLNVGDAIFYGCGQNVTAVYRITGWDTFRKSSGTVTLTPAQVETAKLTAFKVAAITSSAGKLSHIKKYVAATLPRLATPPVLDGKLDDAAWKQAGVVDDFRTAPAEEDKDPNQTTVLVGYDDDNLYFGIRCNEAKMDKLHLVNSPVYTDDCLEIFVDRACSRTNYHHFIINANGVYYVGYGWAEKPNVKIFTKAGREAGAWVVEVAVPWKNIDTTAPKAGDKLGFNVVRNRHAEGENYSNWSPLHGNLNHSPQYFGTLYVGTTLPREAQALIDGRAFVKNLQDTPITLDGNIDEWKSVKPQKIMDGTKPMADLYLGWKPDGLYAAFDVTTDKPWKNAAAYDMAFNGGACCDLQLGPIVKEQKEMVPGDVRFLASTLNGKDSVVEFLPKLTADLTEADKASRKYHTDAQGDNLFDRLAVLAGNNMVAKAKPDGKGYIVEMRVPLRTPLKLESGQRFKFDASLILANTAGNRAELRLPWFSTSGDDMFVATDVVMETRLRPWNWGEAELE